MLEGGDDLLAFGVAILNDEAVVRGHLAVVVGLLTALPTAVRIRADEVCKQVGLFRVAQRMWLSLAANGRCRSFSDFASR